MIAECIWALLTWAFEAILELICRLFPSSPNTSRASTNGKRLMSVFLQNKHETLHLQIRKKFL